MEIITVFPDNREPQALYQFLQKEKNLTSTWKRIAKANPAQIIYDQGYKQKVIQHTVIKKHKLSKERKKKKKKLKTKCRLSNTSKHLDYNYLYPFPP